MTARRAVAALVLAALPFLGGCDWHPGGVPHVAGSNSGSARAN